MVDDELARQWRDVDGSAVLACERCGRPLGVTHLRPADPDSPLADQQEAMLLCDDCRQRLERGTEPLDLDDDDDLEPPSLGT